MALFAAGGEALWGPVDVTPLALAGLVAAGVVLAPAAAVTLRAAGARWAAAWRWGACAGLACVGAAAAWCLAWLLSADGFRPHRDPEAAGFLALVAAACGACWWGAYRLVRRAGRRSAEPTAPADRRGG